MNEECKQKNIPKVDNSAMDCDGNYMGSDCVIVEKVLDYFGSRAGKSVTDVLEDLVEKNYEFNKQISKLENEVKRLKFLNKK